jgi:hypothetical protein
MYAALAARLDRLTSALEQVHDVLRELVEAQQAAGGVPIIIDYSAGEPEARPPSPPEDH